MATLKIQNEIVGSNQAAQMRMFGFDATSYADVSEFIQSIPENDNRIDVRIHCDGGSVSEGWAIYDGLRATGKEITTIVDGKAASMATIIMMAAPKERRKAYENATILVHNPYIDGCAFEKLDAKRLRTLADDMEREQTRMLDLYVERCGCDRAELQALMDKDTPIKADTALQYGLIGEIMPPASAKGNDDMFNQIKNEKMDEKQEVKVSLLDKILGKLGFKDLDEAAAAIDVDGESKDETAADDVTGETAPETEAVAMELNTEEGGVLTVERENGEPQIGDKAQPDGEHKMPDGRVIVVVDGVITDIKTDDEEQEQADEQADETEALKAEIEQLRAELAEAKKMAKSKDDLRVLNAVKMAGGEAVLKKFASEYTPESRQRDGKGAKAKADEMGAPSPMRAEIEARKKGEYKKK